MIVSLETFEAYTQNYENSEEELNLKKLYLNTAETIVKDYLGYNPECRQYDEYLSGIGDYKLYVHAFPVTSVGEITVDGNEVDISDIFCKGNYVYAYDRTKVFSAGVDNVHIIYTAGFNQIPEAISMAILRIAALLLQEEGGNIGITSKSFTENSRTFINYTNFKKYLQPLDVYRIVRFE